MKTLCLLFTALLWLGCTSRNAEITKVMNENIDNMGSYIQALESAETPKQFAEAMRTYAQKIRDFSPKLKSLNTKYPDLASTKEVPKGLEEITFTFEETMKNLLVASARVEKFKDVPEVKEAQEELIQAWIDTK